MLQDYVNFARAKGLPMRRIVGVHVLKNILIPIVTVIGLEFGSLIAFAIVTETIFAWPGMGKLLIDSINVLDRPVIVAYRADHRVPCSSSSISWSTCCIRCSIRACAWPRRAHEHARAVETAVPARRRGFRARAARAGRPRHC